MPGLRLDRFNPLQWLRPRSEGAATAASQVPGSSPRAPSVSDYNGAAQPASGAKLAAGSDLRNVKAEQNAYAQRASAQSLWDTPSSLCKAEAGQKISVSFPVKDFTTTFDITIAPELAEHMSRQGWLLDTESLYIVKPDGTTLGLLNQEAYQRDTGQIPPRGLSYDPDIGLAAVPYHQSYFLVELRDGRPYVETSGRDLSGPVVSSLATKAWSKPISKHVMRDLDSRWEQFSEDWAAVQKKSQLNPTAFQERRDTNNIQRMLTSGTASGQHGALKGTDGAPIAQANWLAAEGAIDGWIQEGRRIDVSGLLELNAILGHGLENNGYPAGVVRSLETVPLPMSAGGDFKRYYFYPGEVAEALQDFQSWLGKAMASEMPRVEVAARALQRLVSIHPFADGNGRTARALADWILKSSGLPPATFGNFGQSGGLAIFGRMPSSSSPDIAIRKVTDAIERTLAAYGVES